MKLFTRTLAVIITTALLAGATALVLSFTAAPLHSAPARGTASSERHTTLHRVDGPAHDGFSLTRIAHASVLLDFGNATVLTDPWFSEKAHFHHGELLGLPMGKLPKLTAIVASHAHYDHFDIETFARYPDKGVPFFVGPDMVEAAHAAGFTNVRELRPWQSIKVGSVTITAAPAAHKVPEISFVVQANGATVYFGGDTKLIPELMEIPKRFPSIQLALLPINGLRVLGQQVVMNAEEAAQLAGALGAEVAVPIHYKFHGSWFTDTFILGYDGTPERLVEAARRVAAKTQVQVLEPGERLRITRCNAEGEICSRASADEYSPEKDSK